MWCAASPAFAVLLSLAAASTCEQDLVVTNGTVQGSALLQSTTRLYQGKPDDLRSWVKAQQAPDLSAATLQMLEAKYAGRTMAKRTVEASHEEDGMSYSWHVGSDRFNDRSGHNYGETYSKYLSLLAAKVSKPAIAEIGILLGSGIATWAELFPDSQIFGFDVDPSIFASNLDLLKGAGYKGTNVHIETFDQTLDNTDRVAQLFRDKFDVAALNLVMDDGCHTEMCARLTFKSFRAKLGDSFVYMIEDGAAHKDMLTELRSEAVTEDWKVDDHNGLTVVYKL